MRQSFKTRTAASLIAAVVVSSGAGSCNRSKTNVEVTAKKAPTSTTMSDDFDSEDAERDSLFGPDSRSSTTTTTKYDSESDKNGFDGMNLIVSSLPLFMGLMSGKVGPQELMSSMPALLSSLMGGKAIGGGIPGGYGGGYGGAGGGGYGGAGGGGYGGAGGGGYSK